MIKYITLTIMICLIQFYQIGHSAGNPCTDIYDLYKHECVSTPKSEIDSLSRAGMSSYDYYSETFNHKNFWTYCRQSTNNPIGYDTFKKNVCNKNARPLNDTRENNFSGNTIKTRHGNITLVEKEQGESLDKYFLKFRSKEYPLGGGISAASFKKESYNISDSNVFMIGWSIGNAAEGLELIIDKPDGIYTASVRGQITKTSGKLIFKHPVKYKKDEIIEFDGKAITTNYQFDDKSGKDTWGKWSVPLVKLK